MRFHRTLLLAGLVGTLATARPVLAQTDTTGCPQCVMKKKLGRASWELMAVQLIPWSVNYFLRDAEWAKINFASMWTNLQNPWQYDNNHFINNQFSHPYHGSQYFNAGRTNGYNFWESSAWAFGGSLMWELFGEKWAPSPNDLINTTLGGITLGEMLFRTSSLVLDNTATGFERTAREIGAALINPVRGFNRLIDGQVNDVTKTPPDWRPSKNRASLDIGTRHTSGGREGTPENSGDQFFVELDLDYGDSVDDLDKKPFSFMEVTIGLAEKFGGARALQDLHARGSLAATTIAETDKAVHRIAGYIMYDYFGQPFFEFGAQGFQGGLVSRFGKADGLRLHTELLGTFQPVAALKSDYFLTVEGRDYDYGVSFGTTALARVTKQGFGYVEATGTWLWTGIISGFNGDHNQYRFRLDGKVYPLRGRLGVGGSLVWYNRTSDYNTLDDVTIDGFQTRLFASLSIPRWQ